MCVNACPIFFIYNLSLVFFCMYTIVFVCFTAGINPIILISVGNMHLKQKKKIKTLKRFFFD